MKHPMAKAVIIGLFFAVTTITIVVLSAMDSYSNSCNVCVTYNGKTQCREAYGASRDEAIQTAVSNACSFLASGMTQSVQCTHTVPSAITCEP